MPNEFIKIDLRNRLNTFIVVREDIVTTWFDFLLLGLFLLFYVIIITLTKRYLGLVMLLWLLPFHDITFPITVSAWSLASLLGSVMCFLYLLLKVLVLLLFSFFIDSFKKWGRRIARRRRCRLCSRLVFFRPLTASSASSTATSANAPYLLLSLLFLKLFISSFSSLSWLSINACFRFQLFDVSISSLLNNFPGDIYGCLDYSCCRIDLNIIWCR